MGVVDFDPEIWSRTNADDGTAAVAKVAKVAKVGADFPELSQLSQLSQVAPLPEAVLAGVHRLRTMSPPRSVRADRWSPIVADAVALADAGWASKAFSLGWPTLAIFGAVTDPMGDTYSDGLAVWLGGRELRAISATTASVKEGEGWAYFNRREQIGAKLLWEIDR